jgi:hypothetical protein
MPRHDSERNDELIKARQRQEQQQADPRADRGGDASRLLSAIGNAGVQRLLRSAALHRQADGSNSVDDAVANKIQSMRGAGQGLDDGVRRNLEPAFGEDFSDVRVHTGSEADELNHAVQAEAFTTGKDIFFRNGTYNPGSSDGQKLLAHELTHVVQQRDAPPSSDLTVSDPDDASEREAGHVADSVGPAASSTATVGRAAVEDEELAASRLEREAMTEEEEVPGETPEDEMLQGSFLDREVMPEDEETLQGSFLDRQAETEEEEVPR